jgi:hypothetical protein
MPARHAAILERFANTPVIGFFFITLNNELPPDRPSGARGAGISNNKPVSFFTFPTQETTQAEKLPEKALKH